MLRTLTNIRPFGSDEQLRFVGTCRTSSRSMRVRAECMPFVEVQGKFWFDRNTRIDEKSGACKSVECRYALRGNGKPMSESLRNKLTAAIDRLLRFERTGRGTQGGPMKNESIAFDVQEPYATAICEQAVEVVAPLEALGRSLGYTEKELFLAGNVLNRFAWRYPASDNREKNLAARVRKAA